MSLGPHGTLIQHAAGPQACDGRHEKANRGKAQRQKTTLDGLLRAIAEDVRGS